jgi:predicted cupin superfamily sugar epimerase
MVVDRRGVENVKWILEKRGVTMLIGHIWLRIGLLAGFYEYSNKPTDSIYGGNSLNTWTATYYLIKKDLAPCIFHFHCVETEHTKKLQTVNM